MNSQIKPSFSGVISPTQARSAETQRKLIAATLDLLQTWPFESLSVADITGAANVAVGTFYRRFKSKEAMLPLLYEAYDKLFAEWSNSLQSDERFASLTVRVRLEALISSTLSFYQTNRGLIRALHLNSRLNLEIVAEGSTVRRDRQYSAIAELIADSVETPEMGVYIGRQIAFLMVSGLNEAILYPECTPSKASNLSMGELQDMLVNAACGLLQQN